MTKIRPQAPSFRAVEELQLRPWGLQDFGIEDPFGFYLRFTEPDDILDPNNAVG